MAKNALKKITAEAKRIRKKHPRTSWKSAIKEAGRKYRTGKISSPRPKPAKVAKVGAKKRKRAVKKKAAPRRRKKTTAVAVTKTVVRYRTRVGKVSRPRRHRMAGSGGGMKKIMPFVLLGGAALILWYVMRPKQPQLPAGAPPLVQTTNQVRNQQTNQILQYALAGGLALDAITKLINALNNRSDTDIQNIYDNVDQGGGLPPTLFV